VNSFSPKEAISFFSRLSIKEAGGNFLFSSFKNFSNLAGEPSTSTTTPKESLNTKPLS